MRREIILCEICKKEHDAQYELPKEWIITTQYENYHNEVERHFCSKTCIAKWGGIEPRNDTPPTKMRRFLLVDGETAEITEGVKWNNGCVNIDPELVRQGKVNRWFYGSWDEFKQDHDGSGIQWIDPEVSDGK